MAPGTKDKYASANGLRLHYRDWGGSGQPLVLLHGLASTCRIWDLVAPILAEDFSVVALDQRGHGLSDKPDHGYDFASVSRTCASSWREMEWNSPWWWATPGAAVWRWSSRCVIRSCPEDCAGWTAG